MPLPVRMHSIPFSNSPAKRSTNTSNAWPPTDEAGRPGARGPTTRPGRRTAHRSPPRCPSIPFNPAINMEKNIQLTTPGARNAQETTFTPPHPLPNPTHRLRSPSQPRHPARPRPPEETPAPRAPRERNHAHPIRTRPRKRRMGSPPMSGFPLGTSRPPPSGPRPMRRWTNETTSKAGRNTSRKKVCERKIVKGKIPRRGLKKTRIEARMRPRAPRRARTIDEAMRHRTFCMGYSMPSRAIDSQPLPPRHRVPPSRTSGKPPRKRRRLSLLQRKTPLRCGAPSTNEIIRALCPVRHR